MSKRRRSSRKILGNVSLAVLTVVTLGVVGSVALAPRPTLPVSEVVQQAYDKGQTLAPRATTPPPLAVQRTAGEPLRVLFAGDSLTGALYASSQEAAFKWLMLDELEKSGPVEEFSSAISGGTTVEVSQKYDVPPNLDLAVVELGTNDKGKATSIPEFRAAYAGLLDKIKAGSPNVKLVCAGIWERSNGGPGAVPYNNVILDECIARGGRFQSLTSIYLSPKSIGPAGVPSHGGVSDDFHPNNTGHRAIADALLSQFAL